MMCIYNFILEFLFLLDVLREVASAVAKHTSERQLKSAANGRKQRQKIRTQQIGEWENPDISRTKLQVASRLLQMSCHL